MVAFTGKTFPIQGIPSDAKLKTKTIPFAPGLPSRHDISEFFPSNDTLKKKQWTLMVLAMNRFKALGVEEKLSYFQVAGIHAYPLQPWDGAKPPPKDPEDPEKLPPGANPYGGYCQHNTITFPTWHRPYMLLFEKLVWKHMKEIITEWSLDSAQAAEWEEAADTWRLPYWDWARKQKYNEKYSFPEVLMFKFVTIYPPQKPEGLTDITNPFYEFRNPETENGKPDGVSRAFGNMPEGKTDWNIPDNPEGLPWSKCSATSRYGLFSKDGKNFTGLEGVNNFNEANNIFSQFDENWYNPYDKDRKDRDDLFKPPGTLADAVNRLFSKKYTDSWETFASTKWWKESAQDVSTGYLSLEYIHNNVHNLAGGSHWDKPGKIGGYGLGHMSDVPVSAFDPVFWLHHCNIDRLLAMWQALNWGAWFDEPEFLKGTGKVEDKTQDDDLLPFHAVETDDPKTGYWTSRHIRDWTKLGYQYDDLRPGPDAILPGGDLNEEQFKLDLEAHIQTIYPSAQKYYEALFKDDNVPNKKFFGPHNTDNKTWNDYLINVIYDRYALNGSSYSIQFWLGGDGEDRDTTFRDRENLIGQVYSFAGLEPTAEGCSNCASQKDEKVLSRAQVLLTIPIISQALDERFEHIHSTTTDQVEEYLAKHLHWKFVQIGGKVRPATDFPKTIISVLKGTGKPQQTDKALPPVYAEYRPLYKPTEQKDCGVKKGKGLLGAPEKLSFRTFED
ncbi:Tyrosinase [Fusarium oxysporum f. sp. cubense]|uniref:tyrosinase n=1 Tax=Fusarium oxysporum f. sp. cubense TaxID=61366 RepID=A0A559LTH3_FUSOC|nr:Tyrosinase [Fusarium oxysporum f. sp. cubense]